MSSSESIPACDAAIARPGQFTAMISSTALDLPEHRASAHKACLDAGVFPIGMEQIPARDDTGIAASLEMVDQADIYIGIYAFRYGWVPDGKDISITEMEFDRAVARKADGKLREILVFTSREDHPVTKKDIEADKVAQEKLSKFKARAADGRVRKEFKSAEELHRVVLHALSECKNRRAHAMDDATRDHPLHTAIPNNLPRLQPFFGREEELKKIAEALDPDNRTWGALIDGPGGMGKTSLVIRAAYDCPPDQFERIVFVSVKQNEQDDHRLRSLGAFALATWLEMLNEIARALDLPDVTKAPENERARRLRDGLIERRVLLLLDNLESLSEQDQDQLFSFLEFLPNGCKALLTSRVFVGNKTLARTLQELDQPSALRMLAEVAEHNPAFAASSEAERIRLYHETHGNALLLRWVAGQVGCGQCSSVADALAYLRSCPPDNDPLGFIFGYLVKEFTEPETRVLCALTYFNLPAKTEHILAPANPLEETLASSWYRRPPLGTPDGAASDGATQTHILPFLKKADVEIALRSLSNRSLVVPDIEEETFALVPMVADFLRRHRPKAIEETGDRLEKRAYAMVRENGYQKYDRIPVLDTAWPTIAAALPRFLTGPNDRLQNVCDALPKFLDFTGRWDEWLALSREAEARAIASGDFINAGWRACNAGWVHHLRGESAGTLACADCAESHWREAQIGPLEQTAAIHLRSSGLHSAGDYAAAIAGYRKAIRTLRALSHESETYVFILNDLADAERLSGDIDAAVRDLRKALRITEKANNREGVATCTGNLAELSLNCKDWPGAEALALKALGLAEGVGRRELIACNCRRLAKAIAHQGRKAQALRYAQRAFEIYITLRSPNTEEASQILVECEEAPDSSQQTLT